MADSDGDGENGAGPDADSDADDPPATDYVTEERTHEAPDGTTLALTVFRPVGADAGEAGRDRDDGPATDLPVLCQRTPYGRPEDPSGLGVAARALDRGYAVAYEDVRGRGDSDGEFLPWVHEGADGAATVEYLADRPWSNGRVGTYGGSSPGQVQLLLAAEDPEGLAAMAPMFSPSDLHRADFFQDGAMSAQALVTWSFGGSVGGHTIDRLERAGHLDESTAEAAHGAREAALADVDATVRSRPLADLPARVFADVDLPGGVAPGDLVPHWSAWTDRPTYDEFWRSFDPEPDYGRTTVPGLHVTGWYELCQQGTLTSYRGLRDRSPAPQHLLVGPWTHQNTGREVGNLDFGAGAGLDGVGVWERHLDFFDTYVREDPTPPFDGVDDGAGRYVETLRTTVPADDSEWIRGGDWPPADTRRQRWFLTDGTDGTDRGRTADHGDDGDDGAVAGEGTADGDHATADDADGTADAGDAAADADGATVDGGHATADADEGAADADDRIADDGRLARGPPAKFESPDRLLHDPAAPVPTRGGPLCCGDVGAGPRDQRPVEAREDVLTYATPPLSAPVTLAGPVRATLTVGVEGAADADVVAKLVHVTADGPAYDLCQGIRRLRYRHGRDRPTPLPDGPVRVPVNAWDCHHRVPAGDRLRLQVAASDCPRFDPHPGVASPWTATDDDAQSAELTVHHALDRESALTATVAGN